MTRAGELIVARAAEFTQSITLDVGSPLQVATIQPPVCKLFLDWHAAQAPTFPWEDEREGVWAPCWCGARRSESSAPSFRGTSRSRCRSRSSRQRC